MKKATETPAMAVDLIRRKCRAHKNTQNKQAGGGVLIEVDCRLMVLLMLLPIVCNLETVPIWLCIHLSVESRMIRFVNFVGDLVKMIGRLREKKRLSSQRRALHGKVLPLISRPFRGRVPSTPLSASTQLSYRRRALPKSNTTRATTTTTNAPIYVNSDTIRMHE